MAEQSEHELRPVGADTLADLERLVRAIRALENAYSEASVPPGVAGEVAATIEAQVAVLARFAAPEVDRVAGRRPELEGFAQVLVPPLTYLETSEAQIKAEVTCGPLYLGSGAALHGGVAPLLLDDVMGRLANGNRLADPDATSTIRTAYLHVNYRGLAPVGRTLQVRAWAERTDGRKRWFAAEITLDGRVLVDAEAMIVQPRH
ncbi:hypothetical protein [Jatrophihabitans sp.]|uniref:PaaI family thioesterase n=1 Tax=Jatrophihabitans sp. TaxID=1932789 RepID=UPI0030C76F3E|nr:PaaI family thioesterase [Jatrophihabitans sp.]